MNALGNALVWCAVQVTVFGGAAALLYLLMRRLSPASRSTLLATALFSVILLSLLAWSPWPRWIANDPSDSIATAAPAPDNSSAPDVDIPVDDDASRTASQDADSGTLLFFSNLWDEMKRSGTPAVAESTRWNWRMSVAELFLCGVGLGVTRLLTGLWSVRRYRRRSAPIDSPELDELLDIVRAELSCPRPIELRESRFASSPATIGWRRPLILLPPEWREWSDAERHAVLAHEVAHIRRFDFPAWVLAQLGVVLHFYHPIVHWLAGRLRLEQELAADAAAAAVTGGNSSYLQTLAGMALRQPERPLSWPARTFLPSHHTFLRRIEMLRQRNPLTAHVPRLGRALVTLSLCAAVVFAAGLRFPFDAASSAAAPPEKFTSVPETTGGALAQEDSTLSLAYVPRDAIMVMAAHPAEALKQPFLAVIAKSLREQGGMSELLGFSVIDDLRQVTAVFLPEERNGVVGPDEAGIVFQFNKDIDADALVKLWIRRPQSAEFGGQSYFKGDGRGKFIYFATPRTMVVAESEEHLRRFIVAGERGATKALWAEEWSKVAEDHAAMFFDLERIRPSLNSELQRGPAAIAMAPVSPIWNQGRYLTQSVRVAEDVNYAVSIACENEKGAATVEETVKAALILSRNSLSQMRTEVSRASGPEAAMGLQAMDFADEVLDNLKVETIGRQVRISARIDASAKQYVAMLIPAVQTSRTAARRAQSMNNLKQIALAFHNYADVHGQFPPAVVIGPDGKTPHSWRVAILPYIEQQALYQQYKFDEPWDSENNKKIAEAVIPVYQCPEDDRESTNSSYFALVGNGTVFDNPKGTPFREITDGTSNTLMIVESKKAVPWSKPEDIPVDLTKDLPPLGGWYEGGFIAAICDGSVRFISSSIDVNVLKALITKSGGEVIPQF